jgi:hypothetical protein
MNQNTYLLLHLLQKYVRPRFSPTPKLNAFSHWMVESFKNSFLPKVVVVPFSYLLPIAEFGVGLLLIIGPLRNNL